LELAVPVVVLGVAARRIGHAIQLAHVAPPAEVLRLLDLARGGEGRSGPRGLGVGEPLAAAVAVGLLVLLLVVPRALLVGVLGVAATGAAPGLTRGVRRGRRRRCGRLLGVLLAQFVPALRQAALLVGNGPRVIGLLRRLRRRRDLA